ncbi:hypothetical protein F4779DRAFT_569694 [Xylariaceae sp. FL0662B]|nr:hypothetical protein F4779DRAFT_569694 [Xylariaceae sp. FL0662B]
MSSLTQPALATIPDHEAFLRDFQVLCDSFRHLWRCLVTGLSAALITLALVIKIQMQLLHLIVGLTHVLEIPLLFMSIADVVGYVLGYLLPFLSPEQLSNLDVPVAATIVFCVLWELGWLHTVHEYLRSKEDVTCEETVSDPLDDTF